MSESTKSDDCLRCDCYQRHSEPNDAVGFVDPDFRWRAHLPQPLRALRQSAIAACDRIICSTDRGARSTDTQRIDGC